MNGALDIATVADTCDPPRFTGTAQVGLFETPTAIQIFDVGAQVTTSQFLQSANGYAAQIPENGKRLDPCPPSQSAAELSYAITGASSTRVDVVAEETWTIASACPVSAFIASSPVPTASCGATRELHYTLVSACAAPCKVVQRPNLMCACD